jgi:hypothetical protein
VREDAPRLCGLIHGMERGHSERKKTSTPSNFLCLAKRFLLFHFYYDSVRNGALIPSTPE